MHRRNFARHAKVDCHKPIQYNNVKSQVSIKLSNRNILNVLKTKEDSMNPTHVTECLKASYAAPCFLYFSSNFHAVFWYNSSNSLPDLYCNNSPTCRNILFTYNSNFTKYVDSYNHGNISQQAHNLKNVVSMSMRRRR